MKTIEEFINSWYSIKDRKKIRGIREIYLGTMSGVIATSYEYMELINKPFMKLSLYAYQVAIICLGDIIKVG